MATASFHIHLPSGGDALSKRVARLALVFRLEEGEVYPLTILQEQNNALQALVAARTHELQQSQALYRLLMSDSRDIFWMVNAQRRVVYISPAYDSLRGFWADEVVGRRRQSLPRKFASAWPSLMCSGLKSRPQPPSNIGAPPAWAR